MIVSLMMNFIQVGNNQDLFWGAFLWDIRIRISDPRSLGSW